VFHETREELIRSGAVVHEELRPRPQSTGATLKPETNTAAQSDEKESASSAGLDKHERRHAQPEVLLSDDEAAPATGAGWVRVPQPHQ
jgi:hypothetical protein